MQSGGREIISVAQMRAIDSASAASGVPTRALMEAAGQAVAAAIAARFSPRPTVVLCGPGANGGDGWVAARALAARGWDVWVEALTPVETLTGDAADAAAAWDGPTLPFAAGSDRAELVVDALFGAGLSRPLEGEAARMAQSLAGAPERVVAVDLPSGLAGDTGAQLGEFCFRAGLTVTFVRKKPAHVLLPGRALCGEVVVADIGAPEAVVATQNVSLWENDPRLWAGAFPWPGAQAHKHARGHVIAASGGFCHTGAARLAARGALRVGAGLVTIASPSEALAENAAHLTAIMLRAADGGPALAACLSGADCALLGPAFGLAPDHEAALVACLETVNRPPYVLDADALTLLAKNPASWSRWLCADDVLTPHPGEFNRLFPDLLAASPSRVEAALTGARRAGCVVLLKGPDTVVACPDGRAAVNTRGSPFLATAGSGDVLAGAIAGLRAQGMPAFEAACAGAWLHGRVGEQFGPGLIAEDLPEIFPHLLNGLAPTHLRARGGG